MKACPFCAEDIQDAAVVCRFCQRTLASAAGPDGQVVKSADERREILALVIQKQVTSTMRIESRSDFQVVLVYGEPVNHLLHFLIGVFTIGLWWIVWLVMAARHREMHRMITVDEYGVATKRDY